ncbi:uncharacterized protein [Oscarella lobularis]|uniref:uncharacterized protein n=1 Tax=Oscarella lobularis TaxID=121494 RepID=UPI003313B3DF
MHPGRYSGVVNEITSNLYIGDRFSAQEKDELKRHDVTHIVNMAGRTCPSFFPTDFTYFVVKIDDTTEEDISAHFESTFEFIENAHAKGGRVFVHCEAGRSRSATICINYLMRTKGWTLKKAFRHVKSKRPIIMPNFRFFFALCEMEKEITGVYSLKLDASTYYNYNIRLEGKYSGMTTTCTIS